MLADHADLTPSELLDRVLIETVRAVATKARHGEGTNLDLRGRLDVEWIFRRTAGLERGEPCAGGYEARLPNQARSVILLGQVSSKHFMANVDTGWAGTRALPPHSNRGYLGSR